MMISVATANYYYLPFEQTLEVIALAGFKYIELDLYWEKGQWAMAQHLKDIKPREVIRQINRSGLKISSIHDGGGVIDEADTCKGFINHQLAEYLNELGYAPGCIVFHTPHIEGDYGWEWWQRLADEVVLSAEVYRSNETEITIENMPLFDGYYVPLTKPEELLEFTIGNEIGVTLDTAHFAQIGVDIVSAASILKEKIKTIHLSDYINGSAHVFIGDGVLDLELFFQTVDLTTLHSITLECSAGFRGENVLELDKETMANRLEIAKTLLHGWIETP